MICSKIYIQGPNLRAGMATAYKYQTLVTVPRAYFAVFISLGRFFADICFAIAMFW